MKKIAKIIGGIVLAVIVIAGAAYSATAPLAADTVTLEPVTAQVTFTEQGSYIYDRSVAVYPQISGEVLEIKVKQGQNIKKGDVLAVIAADDYERQIKSLESAIAGYEAQISNLGVQERANKDNLSSTRASLAGQLEQVEAGIKDFESAQKSLGKQIELQEAIIGDNEAVVAITRRNVSDLRDEGVDDSQINAARSAHVQAQAALDQSRQQLAQLQAGVLDKSSLEAQRDSVKSQLSLLDQQLGRNSTWAMQQYYGALIEGTRQDIESMSEKLGQANITAPAEGVIEKLPITDANLITQQASVATISSRPVVEVYVPIREIDGVKTGDTVELILDKRLGNESVAGTVTYIENEAEVKISSLGVEERKVRVLVEPSGGDLRIGYSMDVKFTVFSQPDSIITPKTAVFEKDGSDAVWVVENGAAKLRQVTKGVETRDGYAIISGLAAGDMVISDANTEGLKEGKRIKTA